MSADASADVMRAAARFRRERDAARAARAELARLIVRAHDDGASITYLATVTSLSRLEVRRMIQSSGSGG